mgnify:CR=1 FL=1
MMTANIFGTGLVVMAAEKNADLFLAQLVAIALKKIKP